MRLQNLSPCFGRYQFGDEVCDGDPEGRAAESQPCQDRIACLAFALHLETTEQERDSFLEYELGPGGDVLAARAQDEPGLLGHVSTVIQRKGIADTGPAQPLAYGRHMNDDLGIYVSGAGRQFLPFRGWLWNPKLKRLVDLWRQMLPVHVPGAIMTVPPDAPCPGQIVERDKSRAAGYLTYHLHRFRLRKWALARIWTKQRTIYADVDIPVRVERVVELLGETTAAGLNLKSIPDTKSTLWHTRFRRSNAEALELAAETVGMACRAGDIRTDL